MHHTHAPSNQAVISGAPDRSFQHPLYSDAAPFRNYRVRFINGACTFDSFLGKVRSSKSSAIAVNCSVRRDGRKAALLGTDSAVDQRVK